ncbi:MAG: hypothetical protein AB1489_29560 [Acidobacteriota bacterium]
MAIIKIKNQSLPLRCEICHLVDCFDATRNYCTRCADLQPDVYQTALSEKLNLDTSNIGAICGASAGILLGVLITALRGRAAIPKLFFIVIGLAILGAFIGAITGDGISHLRSSRSSNGKKFELCLPYIDRSMLLDGLMVATITVGSLIVIWAAIISMNSWLLILLLIFSMLQLCRQ